MGFFNSENGAANQAKALASRAKRQAEQQLLVKAAETVVINAGPLLPLKPADAAAHAIGEYAGDRLLRVRAQLSLLDEELSKLIKDGVGDNAQAIDRVCAAQQRLSEQERILSGRPLPGSHRPRSDSRRPRAGSVEPLPE